LFIQKKTKQHTSRSSMLEPHPTSRLLPWRKTVALTNGQASELVEARPGHPSGMWLTNITATSCTLGYKHMQTYKNMWKTTGETPGKGSMVDSSHR
jgi:hypothetical protein